MAKWSARTFRSAVAGRPQVTFDELDTMPKHIARDFGLVLDALLEDGWERHGISIPSLAPPLPWNRQERSFSFHLHAWEPLTFLLKGSCTVDDQAKRQRYFEASFAYALDWLNVFQVPVLKQKPERLLGKATEERHGMAWYDMAVGQRIYRLAFLLDTVCREPEYDDATVELLYKSLHFHHRLLAQDQFFVAHSNHGLYQALGQLAAAKRFLDVDHPSAPYFELAGRRLGELIQAHFSGDDVHLEHSPGYHYMLLGSLIGAQQTGLIESPHVLQRVRAMEEALTWMILPDFSIATFGDTDPRHMVRGARVAGRYRTPALQALISGGEIGVLPGPGVKGYRLAGYAFARLHQKGVTQEFGDAAYLAQMAGFHSRVHKHADHLSFIWYDKGRDILIDPGRYAYIGRTEPGTELHAQGFWYSDPKRIYCESTRAHNTVEVDGRSYPRWKVKPFGSALSYAAEEDGCAVFCCTATHLRAVRHRRVLVMEPGRFLLVLDWLFDRSGVEHDYRQWFHFASDWQVEAQGAGLCARHPGLGRQPLELRVACLADGQHLGPVVRGQEEPELLGWLSNKANSLVPTCCFHTQTRTSEPATLATLFVLGSRLEVDSGRTRFNRSLSAGRVAWSDERGTNELDLRQLMTAAGGEEQ